MRYWVYRMADREGAMTGVWQVDDPSAEAAKVFWIAASCFDDPWTVEVIGEFEATGERQIKAKYDAAVDRYDTARAGLS